MHALRRTPPCTLRRALRRSLAACAFLIASPALSQSATQPVAVIDTTAGRLTCTLFTHERPATTARFIALAEGTAPWVAPDGSVVQHQPFYDGTRLYPSSLGIAGGSRATADQKPAAQAIPAETAPPLLFDRPGLLAMAARKGEAGPSRLLITDHANAEAEGRGVIFGQCDEASIRLVAATRHLLQSTDNHPATPVAINHIAILAAGQPLPSVAPAVARAAIVPALPATPLAPLTGPEPTGPVAVLDTTAGTLRCRLFTTESPVATSVFTGLVNGTTDWTDPRNHTLQHSHRFYDGMIIDRVLPDYYIQFGDITGDISGNVDIGFHFKNESTPGLTFDRPGRLAFGNGGPDTNNSELFFALNPMHTLDGGYTIIGQCDQPSLKILDAIAHLPRSVKNLPLTPVVIRSITLQP